ncbi:MAG: hypothetical protein AAF216_15065, partial [Pseudomonadota bacterium]
MKELKTHTGGCHCKAVRFEVDLPDVFEVEDCNCSICAMSGNIHVIVPAPRFRLVKGADHLSEYTFNTGGAKQRAPGCSSECRTPSPSRVQHPACGSLR